MPTRPLGTIALLAAILLAGVPGCATRHIPDAPATRLASAPAAAAITADFPVAASILSGFEVDYDEDRIEHPSWRWGDRVLLGLRFRRDGQETVRYLFVCLDSPLLGQTIETSQGSFVVGDPVLGVSELTSTWTFREGPNHAEHTLRLETRYLPLWVRLYDEAGAVLTSTSAELPEALLGVGMYDNEVFKAMCRATGRDLAIQTLTDAEHLRTLGFWGFDYFTSSLGENRILADLAESIVRRPPWWRIMLNPRFALTVLENGRGPAPEWSPLVGAARPAYSVPLLLQIAGDPVLTATLTVVPADPPLGLCAGIVRIEAHRPGETETSFEVRLLAAKRGDREGPPRNAPETPAPSPTR